MTTTSPVAWETIDPETARRYLTCNTNNYRPCNQRAVETLARDMSEGAWVQTGQPIIFGTSNGHMILLDGQHRLEAIVKSGVTVPMLVVRDAPVDAVNVIDVGRKRYASDAVARLGFVNKTATAAAASLVLRVREDAYNTGRYGSPDFTQPARVAEEVERNRREYERWAGLAHLFQELFVPRSALVAFGVITDLDALTNRTLRDDFIEKTRSGVGLEKGAPALAFRNYTTAQIRHRATGARGSGPQFLSALITAYNAEVSGRPLRTIKAWRAENSISFPRLYGK